MIVKLKISNFHLNLPDDVISGVLVVLEVPKVVMVCSGDVMVANVVDLAVKFHQITFDKITSNNIKNINKI